MESDTHVLSQPMTNGDSVIKTIIWMNKTSKDPL